MHHHKGNGVGLQARVFMPDHGVPSFRLAQGRKMQVMGSDFVMRPFRSVWSEFLQWESA